MKPEFDYSTIKAAEVEKLPLYTGSSTYYLQEDPGNGCYLDPPGYPTYFTRSVYTARGNNPQKGPQMVISATGLSDHVVEDTADWEGCEDYDAYRAKIDARLKLLYNPLPFDHPRVRAWILELYAYFKHCYQDPEKGPAVSDLLIWPIPSYKLKRFVDDPRFSDEWREKESAAVEQYNREVIAAAEKIAVPENHRAVKIIREIYPEYQPELELIAHPPAHPGDWWERFAEKPTPGNCPGLFGRKHPASGSWCQMCGWHGDLPAPKQTD